MRRGFLALALGAALLLPVGIAGAAHADGWRGHGHRGHYRHGRHDGYRYRHSYNHFRPRVYLGLGPAFYWGPAYYYPPPPPAVYRERVIIAEPPVYIERQPAPADAGWWYYCESAGAYYPQVPSCAEPWVKVPPRVE